MITQEKKIYSSPVIEKIVLDNQISLILESNPPFGPSEAARITVPNSLATNPFRVELG